MRAATNGGTVSDPQPPEDELVHVVCFNHQDIALCGIDVAHHSWTDVGPQCATCASHERTHHCEQAT